MYIKVNFVFKGLPEIQVNYDRTSINAIPSIDIKFQNGHQDHFVLNRHYTSEGNRIENELNCNFIGHLANEKTACVAVTGCSGKDMEFTILSKHSQNSLFKLSMDGKLEALDSVSIGLISFELAVKHSNIFDFKNLSLRMFQ